MARTSTAEADPASVDPAVSAGASSQPVLTVQFVRRYDKYVVGDVANFDPAVARQLAAQGFARAAGLAGAVEQRSVGMSHADAMIRKG